MASEEQEEFLLEVRPGQPAGTKGNQVQKQTHKDQVVVILFERLQKRGQGKLDLIMRVVLLIQMGLHKVLQ